MVVHFGALSPHVFPWQQQQQRGGGGQRRNDGRRFEHYGPEASAQARTNSSLSSLTRPTRTIFTFRLGKTKRRKKNRKCFLMCSCSVFAAAAAALLNFIAGKVESKCRGRTPGT